MDFDKKGMVMGKLGDFSFYMHENGYKKLKQSLTASRSSFTPIQGQKILINDTKYERKFSLSGVLVVQPINALKDLESYLISGECIRFSTIEDDFLVVINSLNSDRSFFLEDGKFTVQNYDIGFEESFNGVY